ncbi:uncharacterized protein LOC134223159 [Armigeres subalbatus]|uniref:uncharacterized protein LOC134223159 n=1 Tax=Armigeres subalbatus TaxID=124917 RepID=UPI002ED2C6C8
MESSENPKPAISANKNHEDREERVCVRYEGRLFSIPRGDYERRISEPDGNNIQLVYAAPKFRTKKLAFELGDKHVTEDPSTASLFQSSTNDQLAASTDNKSSSLESILSRTASGVALGKESFSEKPAETYQQNMEMPSTENVPSKSSKVIANKLYQLRSSVVRTIDQYIQHIETEQEPTGPDCSTLHPDGDGSMMLEYRKRNMQVLKTDSFVRAKKQIRTKLYREIDALVKRLHDLESAD